MRNQSAGLAAHRPAIANSGVAPRTPLADQRVMIVEDEFLLALTLEDDLKTAGAAIVGPYTTVAEALAAIDTEHFDIAVLDINLNGEMSYPVADALIERQVPLVLLTGYSDTSLPERFRLCRRLSKPYQFRRLIDTLSAPH